MGWYTPELELHHILLDSRLGVAANAFLELMDLDEVNEGETDDEGEGDWC